MEIAIASIGDMQSYYDFLKRQSMECGHDGEFIFSPLDEPVKRDFAQLRQEREEKWSKAVTDIGWERVFIAKDNDLVIGEIQLKHTYNLKTCLHRASLSMYIEKDFRKQGLGSQLMEESVFWLKQQPSLAWVDLCVFANNLPAIKLYKKFGFIEAGRRVDMFRVHGKSVDDMEMILKLI